MSNILDVRTARELTIKADHLKNFSVTISGIDTLDSDYLLTLRSQSLVVTYSVGSGVTITPGSPNVVTISFTGSDFIKGTYIGTFESDDKDADTYIRLDVKLILS